MSGNGEQPRFLDTRISLQWLIGGVMAGLMVLAGAGLTWGSKMQEAQAATNARVVAVEGNDREQEKHFSRIEGAIAEQRIDTRDSLRSISQDIKDLSNKVDQLKDQMIANSVANRPEVQRWSKQP